MKDAEKFLASRMKFRGRLCAVAIGVSFFIIILSLGISGGFRKEIFNSLREMGSDIVLSPVSGGCFKVDTALLAQLRAVEGVREVHPVVYKAGIVRDSVSRGILFKGVESYPDGLSARIPSGMALSSGLAEGDTFTAYFMGSRLKARNFKVGEIYENALEAEDKTVAFVGIGDLRRVCGYSAEEADALELTLSEGIRGREGYRRMALETGALAYGNEAVALAPETLYDTYPQLFDWLDLIDVNVVAILILMTIVAGFNMISGLLIVLFRSISSIGTLKALGMTDRGIAGVFLRLSARMVLKGMAVGNAAALLICRIQSATHVLKLNASNYFLSFVPVSIDPGSLVLCDILAFAGIMVLILIPTLFISRVDPAETLKAN